MPKPPFLPVAETTPPDMVIVPLADILNLGDEARLNTPGSVGSPNWEWRLTDWKGVQRKKSFVRELAKLSKRG